MVFRGGTHHKVHQAERKHDNLIIYNHHLRSPFAEEACMSFLRIVNASQEAFVLSLHPLATQCAGQIYRICYTDFSLLIQFNSQICVK